MFFLKTLQLASKSRRKLYIDFQTSNSLTLLLLRGRLAPHFFLPICRGGRRERKELTEEVMKGKREREALKRTEIVPSFFFSKEPLLKFAIELCIMHPVTFLTGREPQLQCRR